MGVHKRRWRRRRPDIAPAPDRLCRDFTAARPNQRWVADITEFPTGEGKLHLAGVRDLCHRGLVGYGTRVIEVASSELIDDRGHEAVAELVRQLHSAAAGPTN